MKKALAAAIAGIFTLAVSPGAVATPVLTHHCAYHGGGWSGGGVNCPHNGEWTIAGDNRYSTAVEVSKTFWLPGEAANVYVANGQTLVDALAAGPSLNGPILLVPTGREVPQEVLDEVARLAPTNAVIRLGGDAAVHPDQLLALSVAAGFGN